MERMSTRRGGERAAPPTKAEAPVEEKETKASSASASNAAATTNKEAGSSSAGAAPAPAAASSSSAGPSRPPKRMKVDHEEASWGGPPPPAGKDVIPQPLLPIHRVAGSMESVGFADGSCEGARFHGPTGIALTSDGSLVVADSDNRRLRKIVCAGDARMSAANGDSGRADGPERRGSGGKAAALVNFKCVATVAGCGQWGVREGRATGATLCDPHGVVVDGEGNIFITDAGSHSVRRMSPSGEIAVVAGSGKPGFADGRGSQASFEHPCAS